jgi:hypothetical protein
MAFSETSKMEVHARAELRDVFALSNHGTVLIIAGLVGVIKVGDDFSIGSLTTRISGIGSIRFADPSRHPADAIALQVDDPNIEPFSSVLGQRAEFSRGA